MDEIVTEKVNKDTIDIDISPSFDIVRMINNEDIKVANIISHSLDSIAKAVDIISENFLKGGRLFYFGAGTSGRLGVLDASECPPTFNTDPDMVQGIIAGGDIALRTAIEGAEDSIELANQDFSRLNISSNDTVVAISASGNADYVIQILNLAQQKSIKTVAICCNKEAKLLKLADIAICVETGPEVISGSTRLKAGTAQRMILNMLSTASMIKIGKTYKNLMVDVKASNIKLKNRAIRITAQIAQVDESRAASLLRSNNFNIKETILQLKYSITREKAKQLLNDNNGILRSIFKKSEKCGGTCET